MRKKISIFAFLLGFLFFVFVPASASERFCDASFENCRNPLITLIQNENVQIDAAYWFMDDPSVENALIAQIKKGVKVRMLVDPRADDAHDTNLSILQTFATMTPAVPMRKRIEDGILHWKMMLFAGQGTVVFSGANFSPSEYAASQPYKTYVDEAIYFTDDMAIVNSFRTMYDRWWVDTVNYADYANTSGMTLSPSYAKYPIESELCAAVPDGCGMNFLPSGGKDDYGYKTKSAINVEKVKLDVDMFRITNASITDATIAAFQRGVPVRMMVDFSEYTNPARVWDRYNVDRMFMAGIPIKITNHAGQNHEKSVLLYGQGLSVWGSSNWTAPSFNSQQEHNYFSTSPRKPWEFQWFVNSFERRWNSAQEYRAFRPIGPNVPVYKTPANGASAVSQNVTLQWDGGPWGQIFDIYLNAGTSASKLIASNVVTGDPDPAPNHVYGRFPLSGLAPGTTYSWKIVSKTMALLTQTGPTWTFTTGGTAPTTGAPLASISPASGPASGGTLVTITGTGFATGATVNFDFAAATQVTVVNSTTITAKTPPHVAGSANVTVTSGGVSQSGSFAYAAPPPVSTQPRINIISPSYGAPAGGTGVTISGINFVGSTKVTIGGALATITDRTTVSIQVTTPPGTAGPPVDVVVTTPSGTTTLAGGFTYVNPPDPPSVSSVSPPSGSFKGGTPIVISGSGFGYGAVVTFGGPPAATGTTTPGTYATTMAVTNSATVCGSGVPLPCVIATTPPHATGATDVVVTNMNPATGIIDSGSGTGTLAAAYTFLLAPAMSKVSPPNGTVSGGTQITVTGTNFQSGATVLVGGQAASIVSTSGTTSITAVTPAGTAGTSPVMVVNPDGQSSNTLIFTYQ